VIQIGNAEPVALRVGQDNEVRIIARLAPSATRRAALRLLPGGSVHVQAESSRG